MPGTRTSASTGLCSALVVTGCPSPAPRMDVLATPPTLTATGSGGMSVAAVSVAGFPYRWCSQNSGVINPGPVQSVWRWVGSRRLRTARTRFRL